MGSLCGKISRSEVHVPILKKNEPPSIQIDFPDFEQLNDPIIPKKDYFPGLDLTQAENILLQPCIEKNTFLIGDSSVKGEYTLSVRNNDTVEHFTIENENGKFYLEKLQKFTKIEDLISYYSTEKDNTKVFLLKPLTKAGLQGDPNIHITNSANKLSLTLTSSKRTVTPQTNNSKLVVCTISSCEGTGVHIPLSICVVIDLSYTMKPYMEEMRRTLNTLVDQLQSCDKLCIVTFSNEGTVQLGLTATDCIGKKRAGTIISELEEDDKTNIEDGINKAINEFRKVGASNATPLESILLFTDGIANEGCTDYSMIRRSTVDAIKSIKFTNRQLNLSVVAYGTEPPDQLKSLSDACDGLYFPIGLTDFSDKMEELSQAFSRIFGICSTIVAKNIELNIKASSKIRLSTPQSLPPNYKLVMKESNCTINIPFIPAGNNTDIILPIQFNNNLSERDQSDQLVTAILTAHSLETESKVTIQAEGKLFTDNIGASKLTREEQNAYVQLLRSEVIQTLKAVEQAAMDRKLKEARKLIKDMLAILIQSSLPDNELVRCLIETLMVVFGDLESPKKYDQIGCKRLQQLTQAHTQQRNNIAGVIDIPDNNKELLGELTLKHELRKTLDFTMYDGKEMKLINQRFSRSLEKHRNSKHVDLD